MPMAMMRRSASISEPMVSWSCMIAESMVSSVTWGSSCTVSGLPARSNTPSCTRLRANFTAMTWNSAVSRVSPMERRFLRPSKSPVSLMAPASMSLAVILVMAAGVRSRALAICARELMPCWYRCCMIRERLVSDTDARVALAMVLVITAPSLSCRVRGRCVLLSCSSLNMNDVYILTLLIKKREARRCSACRALSHGLRVSGRGMVRVPSCGMVR